MTRNVDGERFTYLKQPMRHATSLESRTYSLNLSLGASKHNVFAATNKMNWLAYGRIIRLYCSLDLFSRTFRIFLNLQPRTTSFARSSKSAQGKFGKCRDVSLTSDKTTRM